MSQRDKNKPIKIQPQPVQPPVKPKPEPVPIPEQPLPDFRPKLKKKLVKNKVIHAIEEAEFDLRKATLPGNYGVLMSGRWEIIDVETEKKEKVFPTKSFTRNFALWLMSLLDSQSPYNETVNTYTGELRSYASYTTVSGATGPAIIVAGSTSIIYNYIEAPAGNSNYGIIVGTGTQTNWYAMGSPATNLTYQDTVTQPLAEFSDRFEISIERLIANATGTDVNLTEIGIILQHSSSALGTKYLLLVYDPISPAYTLPNGTSRLFRLKIVLPK